MKMMIKHSAYMQFPIHDVPKFMRFIMHHVMEDQ
jgi:hypothetical protein